MALAVVIWIVVVGWPTLALIPALVRSAQESAAHLPTGFKSLGELLITSVTWAAIVALASAIIGWLPGRLLGALLNRRGFVPAAAFVLVPLCLPSYLVYYAWWQSWPPETAIHRWVIEHHAIQFGREVTLVLGLVCWSWPLVGLCVAGAAARRPRVRDDMLLIDGAPWWLRSLDRVRTDAPGLTLGALMVFLTTLNNTTCFDLSEVFTFANELRARAALGATPPQVLQAGLPMIAIAAVGAALLWWRISRPAPQIAVQASAPSRPASVLTIVIWLCSVVLPLALFCRGVSAAGGVGHALDEFIRLYTSNALATLLLAIVSGMLAMLTAFGLAMMWHSDRSAWRVIAHIISITWLIWSLLPGTILGLALQAAYNRGAFTTVIFRSPVILNVAHLASAGFVAVLFARWCVAGEPQTLRDLRRLDGAQMLRGLWVSARPTMLAASLVTAAIVSVMAVGEIAVTAQVVPPMRVDQTPIAMTLLNDMHYQRPQTVLSAALLFCALAIMAAISVTLLWRSIKTTSPHT